jgi:adenylylsulfate reductase subunit A
MCPSQALKLLEEERHNLKAYDLSEKTAGRDLEYLESLFGDHLESKSPYPDHLYTDYPFTDDKPHDRPQNNPPDQPGQNNLTGTELLSVDSFCPRQAGLPASDQPASDQSASALSQAESNSRIKVEISSSEPYVQGGHTAGGFWVDTNRRTTINGLWAAGDAAGGAPQKYVTGSMAEAEIASLDISDRLIREEIKIDSSQEVTRPAARLAREAACELRQYLSVEKSLISPEDLEEALQKTMDIYAGGIGADYRYSQAELDEANRRLENLLTLSETVRVTDQKSLTRLWETKDKLIVARSLVAHLKARKETRWPGFGEYSDYPKEDEGFLCYINSVLTANGLEIIERPLVREESYEHPPK